MVGLRFTIAVCAAALFAQDLAAQSRIETPGENIRRRQAEQRTRTAPYWDGFILKHEGNCAKAILKLKPLAEQGIGYEDAQTALGECYLQIAGLNADGGDAPARAEISDNADYRAGLEWITIAAQAGGFDAQGVLVALYAAKLGPDEDEIEAAKWAHLYLTNPTRLNLGAPVLAALPINTLKASMDKETWLLGKQRARKWVPQYRLPDDNKSP